ncbi:MAG: DUF4175 family protein [Candidatus Kapabacteria bacterium]|nr:DUF4175 family protein [Candidatus Kapabacteria bacterium]MDW8012794.1 DUF4175 family protein [Bacteroidota bacterium]
MMASYEATYHLLQRRLLRTHTKELFLRTTAAGAWALVVSVAALLAIAAVEAVLMASSSVRALLWHGWLGFTALLFAGAVLSQLVPWVRQHRHKVVEDMALRVGAHYPHVGDMLCNVLQLMANLQQLRGTSQELAIAAFERVAREVEALDFGAIVDRHRSQRALLVLFGTLLGASLLLGAVEPLRSGLYRLALWHRSFVPPAPFTLRVEPSEATVLRGAPVTVKVYADGTPPATVQLHLLPEQGGERVQELSSETPGMFVAELGPAYVSMRYYASARWMGEDVVSPVGSLRVVERPILQSLRLELRPPAYTRQQPVRLEEYVSGIAVPRGSLLVVVAEANKPLQQAELLFARSEGGDTVRVPLTVAGTQAQGSSVVAASGSWAVVVRDRDGQTNESPLWHRITALDDAPPQIALLQPTSDIELPQQGLLPLRVGISDDYGFSRLLLHYRLAASRYAPVQSEFRQIAIPFDPTSTLQEVPYVWDLRPLKLSPEDRYEFFVEVWDNDAISGPKSARTPILSVQLPSLEQVLRQSEVAQERTIQELQSTVQQLNELRRRSEELNRQLRSPSAQQPQQRWEQQRRLQELLEQHQSLQQRVEQLAQQLEAMTQRLEQVQALSPETLQKYRELQQLLREVRSPQLQQLMERLQQALQQMTPEQLRQALQNFRFNEEEFRAALERTLRLLKRLQAEQKLDALRRRLERLAEQQEQLQQETERARGPEQAPELQQQQEELRRQWQQLQQEWQSLEQLMREVLPEAPSEAIRQAAQHMQGEQTTEALQQASTQLQQGQLRQATGAQRRAASNMRSAAAALDRLWQELQRNLTREVQRQLQKAMLDALELSEQQEQLRERTQGVPAGSQRFAELARRQQELQQATAAVTERVMGVAQRSFAVTPQMARELGQALRSMQRATAQLAERTPAAAQAQQEAMEALNRSVLLLQDALSTLQAASAGGACPNPGAGQGAGGMGFLERLQQLALQQQGITQALQQLLQGRLTMEQQAQLARLAAQQAQVQQALEELARQQPSSGQRPLGDLRRLAEEMRELVEELRGGQVTQETIRRQHRILSRMLDALRSIYERDYEPQREARPGQDIIRPSPPELQLSEPSRIVPEDALRLLRQSYSPDYQRLIERYFELLRRSPTLQLR